MKEVNSSCFVSLDNKKSIEKQLGDCNKEMIDYSTIVINEWFGMTYKSIYESDLPKRDYVRLYCQHLWRHIVYGREFTDYTISIEKILNMFKLTQSE